MNEIVQERRRLLRSREAQVREMKAILKGMEEGIAEEKRELMALCPHDQGTVSYHESGEDERGVVIGTDSYEACRCCGKLMTAVEARLVLSA